MKSIPSLRQLSYLLALHEHGNFGRAAAAMFVSQSALSVGIAELERVLETSLVEPTKRHVRFTPTGEEIVVRARQMVRAAEDLHVAAQRSYEPTGTLGDVVFLWSTGALRKRVGPLGLLVLGGAASVVRWIGFAMDPPLPVLFALQALHALSFTATCLASVELTHRWAGRMGSGRQIVTWATSTGPAGGLAVAVAAPLYAAIGTGGYQVMVLLAASGLLVATVLYQCHLVKIDAPAPLRNLPCYDEARARFRTHK